MLDFKPLFTAKKCEGRSYLRCDAGDKCWSAARALGSVLQEIDVRYRLRWIERS